MEMEISKIIFRSRFKYFLSYYREYNLFACTYLLLIVLLSTMVHQTIDFPIIYNVNMYIKSSW